MSARSRLMASSATARTIDSRPSRSMPRPSAAPRSAWRWMSRIRTSSSRSVTGRTAAARVLRASDHALPRHLALEPRHGGVELGLEGARLGGEPVLLGEQRQAAVLGPGAVDGGARVPELGRQRQALAVHAAIGDVVGEQDVPLDLSAQRREVLDGRRGRARDLIRGVLDAHVGVLRDGRGEHEGHRDGREGDIEGPGRPRPPPPPRPHRHP